jgi:hypothetical protein
MPDSADNAWENDVEFQEWGTNFPGPEYKGDIGWRKNDQVWGTVGSDGKPIKPDLTEDNERWERWLEATDWTPMAGSIGEIIA